MAGFRIEGNTSGNVAEVDATNNLRVTLPQTPAQSGIARIYGENDPGTDAAALLRFGTAYLKPPETSVDYRLRCGEDTLLFTDTFCYAVQNTSEWLYRTDVLTTTWGSGFMTLNGAGVTTIGKTCVQTYRTFPLIGASGFYCEQSLLLTGVPPANWTLDFGMGQTGAATPFAATDGAYFRINSTGVYGVLNYNGTETVSGLMMAAASIGINATRKWVIAVTETECEFWVDDVFLGEVPTPSGNGQLSAHLRQVDPAGVGRCRRTSESHRHHHQCCRHGNGAPLVTPDVYDGPACVPDTGWRCHDWVAGCGYGQQREPCRRGSHQHDRRCGGFGRRVFRD
jgi:hypothetical protein